MKTEIAVFGGGCFWCTEAVFKMLKGVISVKPGYAGGEDPNPRDYQVYKGNGHAEVVYIEFDPSEIKYRDLLTVFFGSHDPTSVNKQGNDIGPAYRSVVFYTTPEQKTEVEEFINEINESSKEGKRVVTDIEPLTNFYDAEDYHKDFFARNREQAYCQIIINPKLDKVQKQFADLLKQG